MRSLTQWIDDYQACHTHPTNRLIHHICVPAIQFSLLGLLWFIHLPAAFNLPYALTNLATLLVVLAVIFYFMLSWRIALGMLLLSVLMLLGVDFLYQFDVLLEVSIVIFIVAWIGQFVGHKIEGKKPSFFEDVRFLLIGPLWVLVRFYDAAGLSIDKRSPD